MHVDRRIAELAARQHDLITIEQLKRLGLGRGAIRHRSAAGRLHSVQVGVYAVGTARLPQDARLLAPVMACGRDAALSHEHAAHVWGMLPPWGEIDLATVHVTVPPVRVEVDARESPSTGRRSARPSAHAAAGFR